MLEHHESVSLNLVGVVDYYDRAYSDDNVIVRIAYPDYNNTYISFNRQAGANKDTEQGGDMILVHVRENDNLVMGSDSSVLLVGVVAESQTFRFRNHEIKLRSKTLVNGIQRARLELISLTLSPSTNPSQTPSSSFSPTIHPSSLPSLTKEPSQFPSSGPSRTSAPSGYPSQLPSMSATPTSTVLTQSPSNTPSVNLAPSSNPTSFSIVGRPSSQPNNLTPTRIPQISPEPTKPTFPQRCLDNPRSHTVIDGGVKTTCKKLAAMFSEEDLAEFCKNDGDDGPKNQCPGVCSGECRCRDKEYNRFDQRNIRMSCKKLSRRNLGDRQKICLINVRARLKCPVSIYFTFHFIAIPAISISYFTFLNFIR